MNSVILYFILFNVGIFFLPSVVRFSGGGYDSFTSFLALFERSNVKIREGEWYRLVTSLFLHANLLHLVLNMYVLFQVQLTLLPFFNPGYQLIAFFGIYFIAGIAGSLTSFFTNPNPSVGASGAIFGVIGAIFAIALFSGQVDIIIQMLILIAINIYIGSQVQTVNNSAHVGGLIAGFALMILLVLCAPQLTIL